MTDIFLKVDGIAGESPNARHFDAIEVLAWHWSITRQAAMQSSAKCGAAKASVSDLQFVHRIDRASPNLARYCFQGKHIETAQLIVCKSGSIPLDYLKFTLHDVMVCRIEAAVSEVLTLEHVALSFAWMKQEYVQHDVIGGKQGSVAAIIDVKESSLDHLKGRRNSDE